MTVQRHVTVAESMLLLVLLCNTITSDAQNVAEIESIRLRGGRSRYEGNVEVEVNGVWGLVCDDGFGFAEADLICREIGHEGAEMFTRNNQFGSSVSGWRRKPLEFWLDDLACENATNLRKCSSRRLGDHDCGPTQIAGVICRRPESRCSKEEFPCNDNTTCLRREKACNGEPDCPDNSDEMAKLCEEVGVVRLTSSDIPISIPGFVVGPVQVKRRGKWLPLCDTFIRTKEAKVLCRNLGFSNGWTLPFFGSYLGQDSSPVSVQLGRCSGGEMWIGECGRLNWTDTECLEESTASLLCSDGGVSVRVEGGKPERGGLLQVALKGRAWSGVCGTAFDDLDAKVACRMLGYEGDARASQEPRTSEDPIWNVFLDCTGHESKLENCRLKLTNDTCASVAALSCSRKTGRIYEQLQRALPSNCGKVEDSSNLYIGHLAKIRGGDTPSRFDSPWKVTLRVKKGLTNGGDLLCGGSIISEDFVLTAAHCFIQEDKHALVIRVGDFNADYVEGSFEEEFAIEKVWIHEEYEAIHFQDNDIALIKIERKWGRGFRFNQRVQPVCLPSPEASFEDLRDCTVAGWGRTIIFSEPTRRPKELQVMVFPDTICEVYFGSFNYSSSLVCVGTDNPFERRPCGGDSGGALVCTVRNRKVLYAMLSSGPLCGILSFSPDVFTAITKYIRWIQERIAPFGYLRSGGELLDPYPYRGTFGDRDRWGGVLVGR